MSFVDVGGTAQEAVRTAQQEAARRAAEEAARRAAEEAARKAAEEAARRAAEEAAARQAQEKAAGARSADILLGSAAAKKAITSRLTAYEANSNALPAGAAAEPEAASQVPSRFGFGSLTRAAGDLAGKPTGIASAAAQEAARVSDPVAAAALDEVQRARVRDIAEAAATPDPAWEAAARAANAEIPLDDEDRRVTRDFNEQELQAYKELSVEDRKKFNQVYDYLHCIGQDGRETPWSIGAREGFRKALVEGRLLDADRDGVRVLDHFQRCISADLAPELQGTGLDTKGQLQTLAYQMGNPGSIFQGTNNNTCVAASLQAQMAARDPGEYMRVARGLIFEGKVTLYGPDGQKEMTLDKSALWSDPGAPGETRATTNQLIQQSFMKFAKDERPAQEGDVLFMGGRYGPSGQYGGGEDGLTLNQAEVLFENVTGAYATPIGVTEENRDRAAAAVEQAVRDNRRIQVGLASDRGGHMVGVIGIQTDESGNKIVRYSDSNDGEEKTMPLDEFMRLATGIVLPSQYASDFVRGAALDPRIYLGGRPGANNVGG